MQRDDRYKIFNPYMNENMNSYVIWNIKDENISAYMDVLLNEISNKKILQKIKNSTIVENKHLLIRHNEFIMVGCRIGGKNGRYHLCYPCRSHGSHKWLAWGCTDCSWDWGGGREEWNIN